jgi:hypothetical protein
MLTPFVLLFPTAKSLNQGCVGCGEYGILDSMTYIYALPDDYFFYPYGDSICSRIISEGIDIVPCLIERIVDTTRTKVRIADSYDFTVGDVSLV